MIKATSKNTLRLRRHSRVRKKISGTPEQPRLAVYRSNQYIYVQVIDDVNRITLAQSNSKELKLNSHNIEAAKAVGKDIAEKVLKLKIENVVFDRGGYLYHGRVKALAEAAREAGLKF